MPPEAVMLIVPVLELRTPFPLVPIPLPMVVDVTVSVPVPEFSTALLLLPAIMSPTIAAVAGDAAAKTTQFVDVAVWFPYTLAVSVTPEDRMKNPPVVPPATASFRTAETVVFTFNVTVKVFATSTSDDVNVGNKSLAVPVGVVDQTSAAFTFPVLRA